MKIKEIKEEDIDYNLFLWLEKLSCKTLKRFNKSGYGNINTFSTIQNIINNYNTSLNKKIYYIDNAYIYGYLLKNNGFKISLIVVDPEYNRRGLGTQLLQYLQEKYNYLICDVRTFNKPSFNFFIKNNFIFEKKENSEVYLGCWLK